MSFRRKLVRRLLGSQVWRKRANHMLPKSQVYNRRTKIFTISIKIIKTCKASTKICSTE